MPRQPAAPPKGPRVAPTRAPTGPAAPVGTSARPKVTLRIVRAEGGPETAYHLVNESLFCGSEAEVRLPEDPYVAPRQARFFFAGGRVLVEDVGGNNGLFVKLREERPLAPGDQVRLGRQRLLVEEIPAAASGGPVWGSPDPGARYRLVQMLEGGGRGASHPLTEGDNQIGREVGDLTFPTDGFVSGKHANVRVFGTGIGISDPGSSNGTFIRVRQPTHVSNGDQFLLGGHLVRVELEG